MSNIRMVICLFLILVMITLLDLIYITLLNLRASDDPYNVDFEYLLSGQQLHLASSHGKVTFDPELSAVSAPHLKVLLHVNAVS